MKIRGFTPLFDQLKEQGLVTSAVYGKIWRYCDWSDTGTCEAGNERLASELGISSKSVQRAKKRLVELGFIDMYQHPGDPDICIVYHDAVLEFILKERVPPHVGGESQQSSTLDRESTPLGQEVQAPLDRESTEDSILDTNIDTSFPAMPEEVDPWDAIAEVVQAVEISSEPDYKDILKNGEFSEPEYVEVGDEFGEKPQSRPKWQIAKSILAENALGACGRKYFASREERARWNRIEKSAVLWSPLMEDAVMHTEWIMEKIDYVREQNASYRRTRITKAMKFTFPALLSMIENEEYRKDWVSRQRSNRDRKPSSA